MTKKTKILIITAIILCVFTTTNLSAQLRLDVDVHYALIAGISLPGGEGASQSISELNLPIPLMGVYWTFDGGPLKIGSKIAGIKKPASCV